MQCLTLEKIINYKSFIIPILENKKTLLLIRISVRVTRLTEKVAQRLQKVGPK